MIWLLLPVLVIGAVAAHGMTDVAERERLERERIKKLQEAKAKANAELEAARKRGEQYLAMKSATAGGLRGREYLDLNGESPYHL